MKLVKNTSLSTPQIEGKNPFSFSVSPNPTTNDTVRIQFDMPYLAKVNYILTTIEGKIVEEGEIEDVKQGFNTMSFDLNSIQSEFVIITFIFDDKFYRSQKVIKK